MPDYATEIEGRSISPPCPYVDVRILNSVTASSQPSPAKIDTGADQTCVPLALLADLDLRSSGRQPRTTFSGQTIECPIYFINLQVRGTQIEMVDVLGVDRKCVLLGRDILNKLLLSLDGPRQRFRLSQPVCWRRLLRRW